MGFWYATLRADRSRGPVRWWPYLVVCVLIVALAIVVGSVAAGQPISSPRPMFARSSIIIITSMITISLLIAGLKDGLRYLAYFYTGLLVYVVLTFEPMHLMGVRYIGVRDANGQMVAATLPWQIGVMLLSHVYEVAGGKLHYFAVPFALGWVPIHGHSQERYTTSKLKSLVQRGWRRRTNPFPSQRQR
jgi:hypothetical protein